MNFLLWSKRLLLGCVALLLDQFWLPIPRDRAQRDPAIDWRSLASRRLA